MAVNTAALSVQTTAIAESFSQAYTSLGALVQKIVLFIAPYAQALWNFFGNMLSTLGGLGIKEWANWCCQGFLKVVMAAWNSCRPFITTFFTAYHANITSFGIGAVVVALLVIGLYYFYGAPFPWIAAKKNSLRI